MGLMVAQSVTLTQLWLQLGMTLLMLGAFAGLAFLAVKYLKPRLGQPAADNRMRLVSRLSLSQRKQIYLVKIDDRELLLGTSENQLVLLAELTTATKKEPSDG